MQRSAFGISVLLAVLAAPLEAQTTPATPAAVHVVGVTTQLLDESIQMSFVAAQDVPPPVAFQCRCQPDSLNAVLGQVTTSGNTIGCKIPFAQMGTAARIDCTLAANTGETLFQASTDISSRNRITKAEQDLSDTRTQLTQCQNLGITATPPQNIAGHATGPTTAEIQFDATPCAASRVELKSDDGETKSADGRWTGAKHVISVTDLTPTKTYKVTAWLLHPEKRTELPSTRAAMNGTITEPDKLADIVTTSTPTLTQTTTGVRIAGSANHAGEFIVELAEYDKIGGSFVAGTTQQKKVTVTDAKSWTADFPLPRPTAAKAVKYRLLHTDSGIINDWFSTPSLDIVPALTFVTPLKITITPVGPVVSWSASAVPKAAELIVRTTEAQDVMHQRSTITTPKSTDISLALSSDDAKWLLDQAKDAVHPVIVARMSGTSVDPADVVTREVELDIVKSKEAVATVMKTVALSDTERDKLSIAGQNVIKSWAEKVNWESVFGWLLKGIAAAVK